MIDSKVSLLFHIFSSLFHAQCPHRLDDYFVTRKIFVDTNVFDWKLITRNPLDSHGGTRVIDVPVPSGEQSLVEN